ncbi:DegT/DnrJ/EryC1/StrS aminotransferase family protein [Akkermansiaceae bacterium]|nr:DegT/DnrJ/EryC1/StrS aminotransferase family protein [Akkermansiaceae bacterium]
MSNTTFSPWPSFSEDEAEAVKQVLLSNNVNYWTGEQCREFENEFAAYSDCSHAVALGNGTQALEIALNALGVCPGDEVITTPRTYFATASAIVMMGAIPVFADVDENSQNIYAESIEAVLTPKTKAVIVVHLAGMPAEMDGIMELASKYDFKVIEDCAQAHGAKYKGRSVGSIGHVGAWSFCQDKIISTGGEGGMVTTKDEKLWSTMWSRKDHGKSYDAVYNQEHQPGFRWLQHTFGTNMRMTEMQAALGRFQLTMMLDWTAKRRRNAKAIDTVSDDCELLRSVHVPDHLTHAYYKHYLFVNEEYLATGWTRDRIIDEINKLGVPCYQGSCPEIYLEKAFNGTGWRPERALPVARKLGETSLMFLVHPTLKEEEIQKACDALRKICRKAER